MCRRVGHIVTDVNVYRDTAMLMCRRVGNIVTNGNNHSDNGNGNPSSMFFLMFIFRFRIARGG